MQFNERLKELRKISGKTQKQIADELNMIEQQYQQYEYGKMLPGFEILVKFGDCFSVSLDYLTCRTNTLEKFLQP